MPNYCMQVRHLCNGHRVSLLMMYGFLKSTEAKSVKMFCGEGITNIFSLTHKLSPTLYVIRLFHTQVGAQVAKNILKTKKLFLYYRFVISHHDNKSTVTTNVG